MIWAEGKKLSEKIQLGQFWIWALILLRLL